MTRHHPRFCFTVEGTGQFPFDMLRYDACWPYQQRLPEPFSDKRQQHRQPHMNQTLFIVTYDYTARTIGRCTGTADISLNDQSQSEIADQILSGLIPGVEQIFECAEGEPRRDVTEDVSRIVRDRIVNEQHELDYEMATWLHKVLGADSIAWPQMEAAE